MQNFLRFFLVRLGLVFLLGALAAAVEYGGWNFLPQPVAAVNGVSAPRILASQPTPPAPTSTPEPTPPLPNPNGIQARILMYHYVRSGIDAKADPVGYRLSVRPEELEAHIRFLKSQGYEGITMAQLARGGGGVNKVVLTFDDGYADFYTEALPILKQEGWPATLYVISNKIGGNYVTWDQIREIQAAGIEIGAHTTDHRELNRLNSDEQNQQIVESKQRIELEIKNGVVSLAYPVGRYNETTLALSRQAGFLTAVTTHSGTVKAGDDPFTYKRIRMNPDMGANELRSWFPSFR